jgi:hypothetical protein
MISYPVKTNETKYPIKYQLRAIEQYIINMVEEKINAFLGCISICRAISQKYLSLCQSNQ